MWWEAVEEPHSQIRLSVFVALSAIILNTNIFYQSLATMRGIIFRLLQ